MPAYPTTLKKNEYVVMNWSTQTAETDPFSTGTFTVADYLDREDAYFEIVDIDTYMNYIHKIPVLKTTGDDS
jgi:hypothetical protein